MNRPPPPPSQPEIIPRKSRDRTYGWCRLYNDFTGHKKWRLIAAMSGVPLVAVHAIVAAMFNQANKSKPRGSLAEFSVEECAIALDVQPEHVARIYRALEERGWIEQDFIGTWYERQPDSNDPTATLRKRAERARTKGEREGYSLSRVTGAIAAPSEPVPGLDGQLAANAQKRWLFEVGCNLVAMRCDVIGAVADGLTRKWLNDIEGDVPALSRIIAETHAREVTGEPFRKLIGEQVARHLDEKHQGPKLNFGPMVVKGGKP